MAFRVLLTRLALHHQFRRSLLSCKFKPAPISIALYGSGVMQVGQRAESKEAVVMESKTPQGTESLESLFKFANRSDLTAVQAVTILNVLSQWMLQGKAKYSEFKDNENFANVCQVLEQKCHQVSHVTLIGGLKSLLEIGVPDDSRTLQVMENEVMWKMRKMSIKVVIACLHFHYQFQRNELQKKVVILLIQHIQRRWVEITDSSDIMKILQISDLFTEEFISKVQDRALEMTEKMSVQDLCKLLMLLSQKSLRCKPLLRAISFHLNQSASKLSAKHLIGILRALTVLTFPDEVLLHRVSNDLLPEIGSITKPKSISSLLTSVGMLKWRHPALFDACGEWLIKNREKCGPREFVSYLATLGRVNYDPESPEDIINMTMSGLTPENVESKAVWLDVVWSLCILGKAKKEHVTYALNSTFHNEVLGIYTDVLEFIGSGGHKAVVSKLKLLNIQGVSEIEIGYTTSTPVNGISLEEMEKAFPLDGQDFSRDVIETLQHFLPKGKFLATNLKTPMGLFIDCEFIVDASSKPVPFGEYGVQSGNLAGKKSLPSNLHRVALLVWDFKDIALNSQIPIGINALTSRLLRKIGYVVVEVPHFEYPRTLTTLKKVQYLKKKIEESIQGADENFPRR